MPTTFLCYIKVKLKMSDDMDWLGDIDELMEAPKSSARSSKSSARSSKSSSRSGSGSAKTPKSRESTSKSARPASSRALTSYMAGPVSGNTAITNSYNRGKEPGATRVLSTLMQAFADKVMDTDFCKPTKPSLLPKDVMAGVATVLGVSKKDSSMLSEAKGNSFAMFYNAGIAAVKKFSSSSAGDKANPKSMQDRAGIDLPISRIKKLYMGGVARKRIGKAGAVFLAGVMQAISEYLIKEAAKVAKGAITNADIQHVIALSAKPGVEKSDPAYGDLSALLVGDGAIPRSGARSYSVAKAMSARGKGEELATVDPKHVIIASTNSTKEGSTEARKAVGKALSMMGIENTRQNAVLALA